MIEIVFSRSAYGSLKVGQSYGVGPYRGGAAVAFVEGDHPTEEVAKALNVDSKDLLLQSPFKSKNEELNDIREKLLVGGYSGMEDEAKLSLCIKTLAECLGYEITGEHMVFDTEVGWFGGEEGDPLRVVSPDGGAVEITHREVKRMVYNIVDYARNELSKQFDPQWQSLR